DGCGCAHPFNRRPKSKPRQGFICERLEVCPHPCAAARQRAAALAARLANLEALCNKPAPQKERGRSSGVEHNLAKVGVGRSNRLARSRFQTKTARRAPALRSAPRFSWARDSVSVQSNKPWATRRGTLLGPTWQTQSRQKEGRR